MNRRQVLQATAAAVLLLLAVLGGSALRNRGVAPNKLLQGTPTGRLDPLPTGRATAAIAQLCEHLTATQTRYPGTDLILRYEVKTRP